MPTHRPAVRRRSLAPALLLVLGLALGTAMLDGAAAKRGGDDDDDDDDRRGRGHGDRERGDDDEDEDDEGGGLLGLLLGEPRTAPVTGAPEPLAVPVGPEPPPAVEVTPQPVEGPGTGVTSLPAVGPGISTNLLPASSLSGAVRHAMVIGGVAMFVALFLLATARRR